MDYLKALFFFSLIPLILSASISLGKELFGPLGALLGFIVGGYFLYRYFSAPIENQCNSLRIISDVTGGHIGRCLNKGTHKSANGIWYCEKCYTISHPTPAAVKPIPPTLKLAPEEYLQPVAIKPNEIKPPKEKKWSYNSKTKILRNNVSGTEYSPNQYERQCGGATGYQILHGPDVWVNDWDIDLI